MVRALPLPGIRNRPPYRAWEGAVTSENVFDVIVIGAGPAGEIAAARAVRAGITTAAVERRWAEGSWPPAQRRSLCFPPAIPEPGQRRPRRRLACQVGVSGGRGLTGPPSDGPGRGRPRICGRAARAPRTSRAARGHQDRPHGTITGRGASPRQPRPSFPGTSLAAAQPPLPRCCPATSPTSRTRSNPPPTARCSPAAPSPAPTSSWTCDKCHSC